MRITVLILGLILGALMFAQTLLVYGLSSAVEAEETTGSGAVGVFMALLWLVACAVVIPLPRVAVGLFAVAGLLGFAASGEFPDLAYWGGISLFLAALSFFGWRGKRRDQAKQDEILSLHRIAAYGPPRTATMGRHCGSCGTANVAASRFCEGCGSPLLAGAFAT